MYTHLWVFLKWIQIAPWEGALARPCPDQKRWTRSCEEIHGRQPAWSGFKLGCILVVFLETMLVFLWMCWMMTMCKTPCFIMLLLWGKWLWRPMHRKARKGLGLHWEDIHLRGRSVHGIEPWEPVGTSVQISKFLSSQNHPADPSFFFFMDFFFF